MEIRELRTGHWLSHAEVIDGLDRCSFRDVVSLKGCWKVRGWKPQEELSLERIFAVKGSREMGGFQEEEVGCRELWDRISVLYRD